MTLIKQTVLALVANTTMLAAGLAAADRVAYVDRQVVRYDGDRAIVVTEPVAVVVTEPVVRAAPAVAVAPTFQRGSYHAGHDCPNCGREQTRISNDDGPSHTHVCPACEISWHHVDAVSAGPTLKIVRRLFGR